MTEQRSELTESAGHRLAANDNETVVVDDEADTEGHKYGYAGNDNETVVVDDED